MDCMVIFYPLALFVVTKQFDTLDTTGPAAATVVVVVVVVVVIAFPMLIDFLFLTL